ncbi:MAG: FG-GAP-like repeat-containing protein [Pseudomonadota bacterium]|nr:VCBS repeat-containing protein [Desulfobacterales bacterium]MBL7101617.1 VCBS repeat-containing protein [Desulfobacteraceae bacterium]MBL7172284.1 VCBS repeat-containing protein [Desulfobacteraceae bacterium]MBU0733840.1 VCBS repeat-containing protein [Pseudomonadota bacterium]
MRSRATILLVMFIVLVSLCFIQGYPSAAEVPKKLAVLPFTMNADRDLTFLQTGIMDMLNSRLAWKGKVQVIEKGTVKKEVASLPGPLNKEKALLIGKALGADYVIMGSLTVFGDSVSIDAKILDVAKSDELVTAFNQSKGMDGVIPTVNQFAEDINAKIMGKAIARPGYPSETETVKKEAGALIEVGEGSGASVQKPSFVQRFKLEIRGLDAGDLDGDGKNELVIIDKDTVYVYKWGKNRLIQFQSVKGSWSPNFIYVSVADLDGNGRAEIYVSNLTATNASTVVLEWDGSKFKEIVSRESWLIRVVDLPGRGKTLVGQKRSTEGKYHGDVYILARKGNGFVDTELVKLPRHGNVFNFVKNDLTGKGGIYTTLLGPWEHLLVYNQEGEQLWKSDDYFGGNLTYMVYMDPDVDRMADTGVRIFIPSPIFLFDINGDGKQEIVVCQNHSKVARIFGDFRWFGSGKVHFMDWDGAGLVSQWTSQKLSGTVAGYQIADVDNDGQLELAIASVTSESYFIGLPQSRLVLYDLKQPAPRTKEAVRQ